MSVTRVNGDAFDAVQDLLVVPIPGFAYEFDEGFAGAVARRFPESTRQIRANFGIALGGYMVYGSLSGETGWQQPYSLAFTALHLREDDGWRFAAPLLDNILDQIEKEFGETTTVATAGVPGTGLSGLRGDATPVKILSVLENSVLPVTIYDRDGLSGDREPRIYAEPPLDAGAAVLNQQ